MWNYLGIKPKIEFGEKFIILILNNLQGLFKKEDSSFPDRGFLKKFCWIG